MQTIGTFHAGKMSKLDSPLGEGTVSIVLSYSARQPMSSIFTERGKKSVLVFLNRVISVEKKKNRLYYTLRNCLRDLLSERFVYNYIFRNVVSTTNSTASSGQLISAKTLHYSLSGLDQLASQSLTGTGGTMGSPISTDRRRSCIY